MIVDKNRNSSILAMGAMCLIMSQSVYSNSTYSIPKINNYVYKEANSVPKLINMSNENSNTKLNESYNKNKKDDYMVNSSQNKIKFVNIVSAQRVENYSDDLGYYEYNEVEHLDIVPRKVVKIKAKIKSAERAEYKLT